MARFIIDYTLHGRASETIEANSLEDARAETTAKVERDDFMPDADEIDDIDFTVREMHPVARSGRELWTTRVLESDVRGHVSALKTTPLFAET